jgi:hypothetical protein
MMTEVSVEESIGILFSESVKEDVGFKIISMKDDSGREVKIQVAWKDERLTITPLNQLDTDKVYVVTIPKDCIKNALGNGMEEDYTMMFKTESSHTLYTIKTEILDNNNKSYVLEVNHDKLIRCLEEDSNTDGFEQTIAFDMKNQSESIDSYKFRIPKISLKSAGEHKREIRFMTDKAEVAVRPEDLVLLSAISSEDVVQLQVKVQTEELFEKENIASPVYDFALNQSTLANTNLNGSFKLSIPIETSRLIDNNAVVCRYNEVLEKWEAVGGTIDEATGMITWESHILGKYAVFTYKEKFVDVKSLWSKYFVETLADKGIIKGKSDAEYFPQSYISRAELVTMIAKTLKLPEKQPEEIFSDVKNDSWFASFVNSAYEAGIIKGNGETFNPDQVVTRQDAAVLIMNAFEYKKGRTEDFSKGLFDDMFEVADYAVEAVSKCSNMGIIKGINTNFYPLNGLTREQAAVLIYKLTGNSIE